MVRRSLFDPDYSSININIDSLSKAAMKYSMIQLMVNGR